MKIGKYLGVLAVLCLTLSGCMCLDVESNISEDGSGTIVAISGMEEETYNQMSQSEGEFTMTTPTQEELGEGFEVKQNQKFTYNNKNYIGATINATFANTDDFNIKMAKVMNSEATDSPIKLTKNDDSSFNLTLDLKSAIKNDMQMTQSPEGAQENMQPSSEEIIDKFIEAGAVQMLKFNMPSEIKQLSGSNVGITIDGKNLTIDAFAVAKNSYVNPEAEKVLTFTTSKNSIAPIVPNPTLPEKVISFSDVHKGDWYENVITEMAKQGLVKGFTDGTFKPNDSLTREQFITMIVNALEMKEDSKVTFTDIADRWSTNYINIAGYCLVDDGVTTFNPGEKALREDIAMGIVKAKGLENSEYDINILNSFSDSSIISPERVKYVAIAVKNGYMNGNANGTFNPKSALTRAEGATVVNNLLKK